ncbi:MAG: hypothetical protein DRP78_06285 [Candidatus Omnitrophota bacterium]|nr:MAG: hypothetical protein DRP78_06285 [Candidatus Omnitrophota bacterium]
MLKLKKINVTCGLIFSTILCLCFFSLNRVDIDKNVVNLHQEFLINTSDFVRTINLPQKSDYILQLKYEHKFTDTEVVSLNGRKLELKLSNISGKILTRYYYVETDCIDIGNNFLEIKFMPLNPHKIDVNFRNYFTSFSAENAFFTVANSGLNNRKVSLSKMSIIYFFIMIFSLWQGCVFLGKVFFNQSFIQSVFNTVIAFVPCSLFYCILSIASYTSPYVLIVKPVYLFLFLTMITLINSFFLNFFSLFFFRSVLHSPNREYLSSDFLPIWLSNLILWLKKSEFSDKCVLVFMLLLVVCVFFLMLGMQASAENLANVAYFVLAGAVLIKFFKLFRAHTDKN